VAKESTNLLMKTSSKKQSTINPPVTGRFDALYVHVPFCKNICDYCALYSTVNNDIDIRKQYLNKIISDLKLNTHLLNPLTSIFIGGGTPTQLREHELKELLDAIHLLPKAPNSEFTIECNPGTVDINKFEIMKSAGVNRLSFGAQSTTSKTRNTLGRRTSHRQLTTAIDNAKKTGFTNINIDLIYGIPGQTMDDWTQDLNTALDMDLPHYSAYSLILEEGTKLAEKYDSVDDENAVLMYDQADKLLSRNSLRRYEISNYAKKGKKCRHNYDIWKGHTYLGLGPAACSFDGNQRWTQINDLKKWLEGTPPEEDTLPKNARLAEIIAFGFRTSDGWAKSELLSLYDTNCLDLFKEIFSDLATQNLIIDENDHLKPTATGLLFADSLAEAFI
jgi:oxygen-independent coproporphyrinogen III oxidase